MWKEDKLQVDVVENDIPLLISRPTMTQLGMILDTANHMVTIEGKQFNLEFTELDHYTILFVSGQIRITMSSFI